jgi:hypothetical protein
MFLNYITLVSALSIYEKSVLATLLLDIFEWHDVSSSSQNVSVLNQKIWSALNSIQDGAWPLQQAQWLSLASRKATSQTGLGISVLADILHLFREAVVSKPTITKLKCHHKDNPLL